jgi:hypothetical protein
MKSYSSSGTKENVFFRIANNNLKNQSFEKFLVKPISSWHGARANSIAQQSKSNFFFKSESDKKNSPAKPNTNR